MELNIFEPRYRLLVRRCMEGNRRFGMATVNQRSQLSPVACQCEILECLPLPDGYAPTLHLHLMPLCLSSYMQSVPCRYAGMAIYTDCGKRLMRFKPLCAACITYWESRLTVTLE